MKRILSIFLLISFIMFMSGCVERKKADNTLIYGSGDYTRINPALDEHGEINILIFDGLTAHDKDNNIVPSLAKSWEYDADEFIYTFYLNSGVKWHDGELLTADDVKFTYEAIMDPYNESENASNYEDIEEITVIDDYTVAFKLSSPNYAFTEYMTMAILPVHLLENEDMTSSEFFIKPIGTGPYKFESWDMGQSISLVRNDEYFKGAANIERIVFKIAEDDNARALQLKSGELDMAQVAPKDANGFKSNADYKVYDMKTSDYRGILYNFANEYWQKNSDLIPALNYAVDRQAIVDSVLLGSGETAYSPIQRNAFNCDEVNKYEYNPKKAEELLVNAGCIKGDDGFYYRNGEKIAFTINASASDRVRVDMAQIVAKQLQDIGLQVKAEIPVSIDWDGQQCCIIGWGSPFDADDHTYKVFGTGKGANYSSYSNADVDLHLTNARRTDDYEQRRAEYALFQKAIAENPAYTLICYIDAIYVTDKRIRGISSDTVLGHHGVGIFNNICEWVIE